MHRESKISVGSSARGEWWGKKKFFFFSCSALEKNNKIIIKQRLCTGYYFLEKKMYTRSLLSNKFMYTVESIK